MNLYFAFYYHIEFIQNQIKFAGEYLLFQHSVVRLVYDIIFQKKK